MRLDYVFVPAASRAPPQELRGRERLRRPRRRPPTTCRCSPTWRWVRPPGRIHGPRCAHHRPRATPVARRIRSGEMPAEVPALLPARLPRRDVRGLGARLQVGGAPALAKGAGRGRVPVAPARAALRGGRGAGGPDRVAHQPALLVREDGAARRGAAARGRAAVRRRALRLRSTAAGDAARRFERWCAVVAALPAKADARPHLAGRHRLRLHRPARRARLPQAERDAQARPREYGFRLRATSPGRAGRPTRVCSSSRARCDGTCATCARGT